MKKIITIKKKIGFLPKRKNQRKWWGGSELKLRGKNSKKSDELARSRGGWGSSYFRRAENLEWRMEKDACWGGWKGIWRGAWEGVQVEPLTLTDMVRNILPSCPFSKLVSTKLSKPNKMEFNSMTLL